LVVKKTVVLRTIPHPFGRDSFDEAERMGQQGSGGPESPEESEILRTQVSKARPGAPGFAIIRKG
jgi:hypothetical protein